VHVGVIYLGCCVFRASGQTLIVYWLGHLSKQNETIAMYARYYWFPGCVDVQSDAVRNARRLDSSAFSVSCQIHKGPVTIPGYQERPANSSLARYHHPSLTDMQYRTPTVLYRSTTHCTGHKLPVIT